MLVLVTATALFVIAVVPKHASSFTETCIGEFCFTTPEANEVKNFDGAKSWCVGHNSTLAVVNDTIIQMALTQSLGFLNLDVTIFINIKLYQQQDNTWILVNGSNYKGSVGNQLATAYRLFGFLNPTVNAAEFSVYATKPSDLRKYLCDFEGTRCQSSSTSNLIFNNRCYVKYENESLTWYQARERCINNGGDLAQFQNRSNPWIPPFDTSWLDQSLTYWVGIRWNDWSWKSSDDNKEITHTSFSIGKPNNVDYSCVCVDPSGGPSWSWTDCDCTVERPFVCLKSFVPTTATTAATSPMAIPALATTSGSQYSLPNKSGGLIVGLVLGLVVILPLAIITLVIIVWNVRLRRRLRENARNNEHVTTTAKPSEVQLDRSTTRVDASESDVHYQHLRKETVLGPDTAMPVYEPINDPETRVTN